MAYFVLNCIDKPGALETRLANRPAHLAYLAASDKVRVGGPYVNAAGESIGSLLIIEVADEAEARAFAAGDPYAIAGLFAQVDIREWKSARGPLS